MEEQLSDVAAMRQGRRPACSAESFLQSTAQSPETWRSTSLRPWPAIGAPRCASVHVNERIVGGRGVAYESESEAMEIVDRAVAALRGAGIGADGVHYLANCFTVGERIADAPGTGVPTQSSSARSAVGAGAGCAAQACVNG